MVMVGKLMVSAAIGETSRETALGGMIAAVGTAVTSALGGWDKALQVLIMLMIADYLTGVLGAIKQKKLNSETMFWGGVRKGVVLVVIALATMCDSLVGNDPIIRTVALYFYSGREGLSVVENLGVLGVPLPAQLTRFLEQLQGKGEVDRNG